MLSVMETRSATVMIAHDSMYIFRLIKSISLSVKLTVLLNRNIKASVDLANNQSVGGQTCHMAVRNHFLHE